jgi:uncharacterized protein (DUF488 family)
MSGSTIFTIGHSNTGVETCIALLQRHDVTAVADVRSHPYSRYLPHFSRPALQAALRAEGIAYVFLGRELGARPEDPACYVDGRAPYDRIAATPLFAAGLERLRRGMREARIALLCAEKDPLTCHRAILVCRHLRRPGLAIEHILADGSLESQHALEQRLLLAHGLQQTSFLDPRSPREAIEEAYDRQGARIAYTRAEQEEDERAAFSS